jgi:hypothetical protein
MFNRIAWGLVSVGLLLLIGAAMLAVSRHNAMAGMEVVPATVIGRVEVRARGMSRSMPRVGFHTLTGTELEFVANSYLKTEDGIRVIYRASNPQDARVYFGLGEYLFAFILALIGAGCAGIGGALFKILWEERGTAA